MNFKQAFSDFNSGAASISSSVNSVKIIQNNGEKRVWINGEEVTGGEVQDIISIHITGDAGDIDTIGDVTIEGNVLGNISSQGSINIKGNVGGKIDTQGKVTCGDVLGSINTMGKVECGEVHGDVETMGKVVINK